MVLYVTKDVIRRQCDGKQYDACDVSRVSKVSRSCSELSSYGTLITFTLLASLYVGFKFSLALSPLYFPLPHILVRF